jgi:hypothetical protein
MAVYHEDEDTSSGQSHALPQIEATPFAPPYRSTYFAELVRENKNISHLLQHVNCNYLNTDGVAPTLTQLKQHAQSLAIMIKTLSLSTNPVIIDGQGSS